MTDSVGAPGLGGRRAARERALELLYEAETRAEPVRDIIAALPIRPDAYTRELVIGVQANADAIDAMIDDASHRWRLGRMPAVDRALLRIGAYELEHRPEVPVAVIISEAVELAGQYSTDESGRFVNGLLSRLAGSLRPGATVEPS